MSSKTRIVVLHMKEIIYTAIFAVLAIVLILLLIFMFLPKVRGSHNKTAKYNPGVYTSDLTVGDTTLSLEVTVSETEITSIHFSNLNETVSAMYPLLQPAVEEIADQIVANQSLDDIQYTEETHYTSQAIINAVDEALKKAAANSLRLLSSYSSFSIFISDSSILLQSDTVRSAVQILLRLPQSLPLTCHLHPCPLLPEIP